MEIDCLLSLVERLIVVNVSRAQIELHGERDGGVAGGCAKSRRGAMQVVSRPASLLGNGIRMRAATSSSSSPPASPGRDAISFTSLAVGSAAETDAENHSSRTSAPRAFLFLSPLSLSIPRFSATGNIIRHFASAIVQIKSLPGQTCSRYRDRVARYIIWRFAPRRDAILGTRRYQEREREREREARVESEIEFALDF